MRVSSLTYFGVAFVLLTACCFGIVAPLQKNLSCYQCVVFGNKECGPESYLPCPLSSSDRCVTNISKDKKHGFILKRECGLGPCSFEDQEANWGLGWGTCDRSMEEYFCVFCCKESGCNKNSALRLAAPTSLVVLYVLVMFILF